MPASLKILVVLCSVAFFGTFLFLAKRGAVKPFYSTLWLLVSALMLSLVVFEKMYKTIADDLGIRDASFLVFIGAILFMLVYILHLSIKMSELSDRMQEVISSVAILERAVRRSVEPGSAPLEVRKPTGTVNPERKQTN